MSRNTTAHLIDVFQLTAKTLAASGTKESGLVADLLEIIRVRLIPVYHREQLASKSSYVVSFVGHTNVGKSTLMEALLGPVAPKKMGPATAVSVEYRFQDGWELELATADFEIRKLVFGAVEDMASALRTHIVDVTPEEAMRTLWVRVSGPMALLEDGLMIADTPGFGAAGEEGASDQQQAHLESFLRESVDRIYFCVSAGDTCDVQDVEAQFFERISHKCEHVIVNKWEGRASDQDEYRRKYEHVFPSVTLHFVNAKRAIVGKRKNCEDIVRQANLDELRNIIIEYSTPAKRIEACDAELLKTWKTVLAYLDRRHGRARLKWRLDAVKQLLELCESRPQLYDGFVEMLETATP